MPRQHKGDRARLTLRLPRPLVARVDACTRIPKGADRNDRIEALLEVGLDALDHADAIAAARDLMGVVAQDEEDAEIVRELQALSASVGR